MNTNRDEVANLMKIANEHKTSIHELYHKMIAAKVAPEIARFWLPNGQYTT